ncbi:hypothetical protein NL676_023832 [Syzygium grande]|nr:hypothetical protein NL676_023832 [Syzygium grande]
MPHGLGQLTLLRTLTDFLLPGDDSCSEKYSGLGELSRLSNLRGSLRIEVKGQLKDAVAESNAANLKEKNSLVSLVLVFPGKESDEILLRELQPSLNLQSLEIRGYGGTRFPSWMSCMPKLVQLRLFDCAGCKSLPSLGELTSLKHLEIGELPIVEYTESDLHTLSSLPNLSTVRIWESPNLEWSPPLLLLKKLKLPSFPLEPLQTLVATTEHVIGIDDRVKDVIKLLEIEDDEVGPRIVGIHGTNGSGKTTIVKAVYNRLSSCFDSCSFLAEIGEITRNVGDDVEEQSHLDDLVGDQLDWFGPGSRIIVTLENGGILQTYVSRGLARTHCSIPGYIEIGKRIVKATGQVPLVIEVIGSFLHGKTIEDWREIEDLIKPQKNSQERLKDCWEILKICYEALDEMQKQIFWDIAWFANGVDSRIASYMWRDQDRLPSHHVLIPLAKIGGDNMLWIHKMLKLLSRTMDQEPKYPGMRSRQHMHVTDLEVINRERGGFVGKRVPKGFEAAEFSLTELVILDLSWSKVTQDWGGWREIKMKQLKVLNLTGCTDLLISPTFSSFPNLEILSLERCSRLVHLDPSIGDLKILLCLNLKSCTKLNRLPAELGALKALKELLIDETSVRDIPLGDDSKELETLSASNYLSLSFLPLSIEHLTSLSTLSVDNSKIMKLPDGVGELVKLRRMSMRNCHRIRKLPESIGQLGSPLEELDISGTGVFRIARFLCLPPEIQHLSKLETLDILHCDMLPK